MWDKGKSVLSFLADVITLLLVLPGAWNVLDKLWPSAMWLRSFFLFFFIAVLLMLAKLLREKYKTFHSNLKDMQIKQDVKEIEKKPLDLPFEQILPSTRLLNRWMKKLDDDAVRWAKDSIGQGPNFYLDVEDGRVRPTMQAHYYSPWKKLEAFFYAGALEGEKYGEAITSSSVTVPPFMKVRGWRKAVLRAFEKVVDGLPAEYGIVIHSQSAFSFGISFKYENGKLEKSHRFKFENGILVEENSGDSEKI